MVAGHVHEVPRRERHFAVSLAGYEQEAVRVVSVDYFRGTWTDRLKDSVLAVADDDHVEQAHHLVEGSSRPPRLASFHFLPSGSVRQGGVRTAEDDPSVGTDLAEQ